MITIYHSHARSKELKAVTETKAGVWLNVVEPNDDEVALLSQQFKLDVDLLQDAIDPYESPRVERERDSVYVYTRYAYPNNGVNATEPLLMIFHPEVLITVARSNPPVLQRLINYSVPVVTTQRTKTLLQVLDEVNASYRREIHKVSRHILGIRNQLSKVEIKDADFVAFIDLEEDLNEYLSALQSQAAMLRNLLNGRYLRLYEEDKDLIEDLSLGTDELLELTRSRLKTMSNTREAYATIMANRLNATFKRLTSISIFMTIPMVTSGLYGMNLVLPFAKNPNAFLIILVFVMSMTAAAIIFFNKKRWL